VRVADRSVAAALREAASIRLNGPETYDLAFRVVALPGFARYGY